MQEVTALEIPFPQITYREAEQVPVTDSIISSVKLEIPPSHTTQFFVLPEAFPEAHQLKQDLYQLGQQYTSLHLKHLEQAIRKTDKHIIQVDQHTESFLRIMELYTSVYKKTLESLLTLIQQQRSTTQRFIPIPEIFQIAMDFASLPEDTLETLLYPLKDLIDEAASEYEYVTEMFNYDEDKYYSKENRNFFKMNRDKKQKHLKALWKKIYNQAVGCSIIIN